MARVIIRYPCYRPEADQAALYQAHMARYAAALGVSPAPFPAPLLPGGPAHHAAYPPELLQAYGLASAAHFPPTSAAAVEIARLHEKIRADEARRLEAESRREADRRASEQLRARERERAVSPAAGRRSGDALLKLSKIADRSQPQAGPRLQPPSGQAGTKPSLLGRTIKLPTAPLDFSELSPARPRSPGPASPSSVRSASPTPVSPSPPPSPGQAEAGASRCRPYVPRPRPRPSEPSSVSTPRKLFVRPFEDDYSPIQPPSGLGSAEEPLDISASSLSPNKECKQNGSTNVDLDDIVKPDDQDSDYESMSSDSSVKKEGSLLCPNSGHLLPDEECGVPPAPAAATAQLQKLGVFREPEADSVSRKDKLNYLRYFRLVTHRRKNDIEIEKLERRRARLRERSPSPEAAAEDRAVSPELPLPSVAPHLNRLPETHAKAMYLSAIGLCRNSEEQKISNEVMWAMILEDRLTREPAEQRSLITKYFVKLRDLPALPDIAPAPALSPEPGARGVKRAYDGSLLPDPAPAPAVSPRYSGLNIPSSDAVSRLAGEGGGLGEAGPVVSLPASLEINLCSLQPIAKPTLLLQDTAAVKAEPGGGPAPAPPAHLQPHLSFPRVLSSPFKAEVKTEPEDLSVTKRAKRTSSPYAWPGVEAILESYKKFTSGTRCSASLDWPGQLHAAPSCQQLVMDLSPSVIMSEQKMQTSIKSAVTFNLVSLPKYNCCPPQTIELCQDKNKPQIIAECEQEKAALLERGARAQAEVVSRRGQVDTMSTRLSSLARLHKTLVGNHGHAAASLDTLRAQLAAISKLVGAKT